MQHDERHRRRADLRTATRGQRRSPLYRWGVRADNPSYPPWRAIPLLFLFLAAFAFFSCGEWVSVGPFVRCGGACEPATSLQCDRSSYKYNRNGSCVCAEDVDCPNYPCELPAEADCFVAGYDASGACVCMAARRPGACGQPCVPQKAVKES